MSGQHSSTEGSSVAWPVGEAAFVTGAASGIGLGIARALVRAGAKVALADVDDARLAAAVDELAAAGGTVTGVHLDVGDASAWTTAADRAEQALGPISILCNNAGVASTGPLEEIPTEVWRWVFSINTEGQFLGISTFVPRFKQRGGRAHVLNTASLAGLLPMSMVGAYSASKFASVGLSMVLRDELDATDIDVSLLCPGTVATRISVTATQAEAELLGRELNAAVAEANHAMAAGGADPDAVGTQVVEAMRERQFLVLTHGEWAPLVARIHEEVAQAFASVDGRHGPDPAAAMLLEGANPVTA
ncbi:MAG TPA: SDR family oxidoreductase [Nocardioides sp.]|nr:SDR family oxidoreductase [Nocardioides sp.]